MAVQANYRTDAEQEEVFEDFPYSESGEISEADITITESDILEEPEAKGDSNAKTKKDKNENELLKDSTSLYLHDVSATKLISREEEIELGKRIAAGDQSAVNELVTANLRLVLSVVNKYISKYKDSRVSYMDLVQEGNLGLIKAAQKYDYTKETRFSTYAVYWIMQGIQRTQVTNAAIRVPEGVRLTKKKIIEAREQYLEDNGRLPTDTELSKILPLSEKRIKTIDKQTNTVMLSLDYTPDDDAEPLKSYIHDDTPQNFEDKVYQEDLRRKLMRSMSFLPDRSRIFILLAFGLVDGVQRTYADIGREFNMSRENVRKVVTSSLSEIRDKHPELELMFIGLDE